MSLNIYSHPVCLQHKGFPGFAEKPGRLATLNTLFNEMALPVITPESASKEWLLRAHKSHYIDAIERLSQKDIISATIGNIISPHVQWYTRVSPKSYEAALFAAGSVCKAVEDTLTDRCNFAFCAVRPPGHHAGPDRGEGFCLFNNVAIGALHALKQGAQRVAIIDFDRHHGNGTQSIVEQNSDKAIMLVSSYQEKCKYSHQDGRVSDTVLNVPLPTGCTYDTVRHEYATRIIPALYDFKPDLILLSAGFDLHKDDPLSSIKLESADYYHLTRLLVDAANDLCGGRIVSTLEGGYDQPALKACVKFHLMGLQRR